MANIDGYELQLTNLVIGNDVKSQLIEDGIIGEDSHVLKDLKLQLVGAGIIGEEIQSTKQLRVLNYKQAMASDRAEEWKKEFANEKA